MILDLEDDDQDRGPPHDPSTATSLSPGRSLSDPDPFAGDPAPTLSTRLQRGLTENLDELQSTLATTGKSLKKKLTSYTSTLTKALGFILTPKGVKFDFKRFECVRAAVDILIELDFPRYVPCVMLNADVFYGPLGALPWMLAPSNLDGLQFVQECARLSVRYCGPRGASSTSRGNDEERGGGLEQTSTIEEDRFFDVEEDPLRGGVCLSLGWMSTDYAIRNRHYRRKLIDAMATLCDQEILVEVPVVPEDVVVHVVGGDKKAGTGSASDDRLNNVNEDDETKKTVLSSHEDGGAGGEAKAGLRVPSSSGEHVADEEQQRSGPPSALMRSATSSGGGFRRFRVSDCVSHITFAACAPYVMRSKTNLKTHLLDRIPNSSLTVFTGQVRRCGVGNCGHHLDKSQ